MNVTVSSAVFTVSIVTSNRSRQASMTPCTRSSGALAPAVRPRVVTPSNQDQSISSAEAMSSARAAPAQGDLDEADGV